MPTCIWQFRLKNCQCNFATQTERIKYIFFSLSNNWDLHVANAFVQFCLKCFQQNLGKKKSEISSNYKHCLCIFAVYPEVLLIKNWQFEWGHCFCIFSVYFCCWDWKGQHKFGNTDETSHLFLQTSLMCCATSQIYLCNLGKLDWNIAKYFSHLLKHIAK